MFVYLNFYKLIISIFYYVLALVLKAADDSTLPSSTYDDSLSPPTLMFSGCMNPAVSEGICFLANPYVWIGSSRDGRAIEVDLCDLDVIQRYSTWQINLSSFMWCWILITYIDVLWLVAPQNKQLMYLYYYIYELFVME